MSIVMFKPHQARTLDAARCRSLRLRGRGNLRGLTTGRTFRLEKHPEKKVNAEYLVVSTTIDIRNVAQTSQPPGDDNQYECVTDFVLQPIRTFFRNRLKTKPQCSPETAVVVGPSGQPMWVDGYARIKVQFVWDRVGSRDENSSIWMRVSAPWQGNSFGTICLPRIGQEVTVSYHEGDPDKPYISDRQVNQFNQPPWQLPKNQALSGTRTRDLKGMQGNQVVADDTPGKLQVQVASDYAQSRLVLGYNTRIEGNAGRQEERGQGWELATSAWGVLRANQGMLVTTEARDGATAPAKDMSETVQRLTAARELHKEMAQFAHQHNAQTPDINQRDATAAIRMQNDAIGGGSATPERPFPEMARPEMAMSSAAGIGMTAANNIHIASQQDHAVTAGRDVSIASGRSLLASVRGAISFIAAQLGMKLFAAKGKVEIQAQSDNVEIIADQVLKLISAKKKIEITAAEEILLQVKGSYIRLNGAGIEQGTPAAWAAYAGSHDLPGPKSLPVTSPEMPKAFSNRLDVYDIFWPRDFESVEYTARRANGDVIEHGALDQDGRTPRLSTDEPENIQVLVGTQGAWLVAAEGVGSNNQHNDYDEASFDDPNHYVNLST